MIYSDCTIRLCSVISWGITMDIYSLVIQLGYITNRLNHLEMAAVIYIEDTLCIG